MDPHALATLLRAVEFSAYRHKSQRRKDSEALPYINHPIEVASTIANIGGVTDLEVLVAAVLHDTLEDTMTTPEELEREFGAKVRCYVEEVTDDKKLEKDERKLLQIQHASSASAGAKLIRLGDKISNVRAIHENAPAGWTRERRTEYLEWPERVIAGCRGVNAALEARYDEVLRCARAALAATGGEAAESAGAVEDGATGESGATAETKATAGSGAPAESDPSP